VHLLAVDDDPSILELLEACILSVGDHTVETATSVTNALELISRADAKPFDCFLIDIQMPETDGLELCQILRDRPEYRKTPILMLTAMSDKSYIDRAFLAGASDYITKPFELGDLRGRIGLMESLMVDRGTKAGVPALPNIQTPDDAEPLPLHEPFHIEDVDGMIDYMALENYILLLSRKKLFESSVFAVSIRGVEDLHEMTSRFEFECLITDVSECISMSLEGHQFLMSYAGNGVFVCIVEEGWHPEPHKLTDQVNLNIQKMSLSFNDGRPMDARVSVGQVIRLVWKTGERALEAVGDAYDSAESESRRYARNLEDFWYDRDGAIVRRS
jgi:CheY-like chemotaxis protein